MHRLHHDPSRIQLCTLMNIKSELRPKLDSVHLRHSRILGNVLNISRRMHGRLQVLLSILLLLHADQSVQARRYRAGPRSRPNGEGEWLDALLHGRSVAGSFREEERF